MQDLNELSGKIIGAAMKVHSALGPGLLESAYEKCLEYELNLQGMQVVSQIKLPITYGEITIEAGYRIDLLVENEIILEIKTVDCFAPINQAQLLSYLKLAKKRLGLLLNFHTVHLKDGIKRMVNEL
jgi:GxxExxY protein